MKVFVTGVGGQLGHDMMNELHRRGYECIGSDINPIYSGVRDFSPAVELPYIGLDITDAHAVRDTLEKISPDAVVHCAAWTAVDAAEETENIEKVRSINADGTRHIAEVCKTIDAKLVYLSTDYIFNGKGDTPWKPTCREYAPLNVYGRTKLEGEMAILGTLEKYFIVRIAWVFGINGNNFIKTMLHLGKKYDTLRVVCDQIGTPTYTKDLSRLLADMLETEKYGIYHATNENGYISWYDFAYEIFRQAHININVLPVTTAEYGVSKAVRPLNSRLDTSKLVEYGFIPLPPWQDALRRYLKEIGI